MDLFKPGMKGPTRPAPMVPGFNVNRYSPVSNWNDDPFGEVFEPTPNGSQKKKPPPRPPPPKLNTKTHPDVPAKPTYFIRRPTVLSSLMSRNRKPLVSQPASSAQTTNSFSDLMLDSSKMFPKCEPKTVQTGSLIDFSSPPSSPTFTTRSSSDGLSVDSFGSDATTSTNHPHAMNGNTSQTESGFEDDYDLMLNTLKPISREDTLEDFPNIDPFSPLPLSNRPAVAKKPLPNKDYMDVLYNVKGKQGLSQKGPTIIRAKPARPKPPDSTSILKSTLGNNPIISTMNVNTTTPVQKISNGYGENYEFNPFSWGVESSPEREASPPMPTIPPPPPPIVDVEDELRPDSVDIHQDMYSLHSMRPEHMEPYAVALFDYCTDHDEDLSFKANSRLKLLRRENDEWFYGCTSSGKQGLFPANFVEIKVPLPNEEIPAPPSLGTAIALFDFEPAQNGDLKLCSGNSVNVRHKINNDWYYGECNGLKGQFPASYVQMNY